MSIKVNRFFLTGMFIATVLFSCKGRDKNVLAYVDGSSISINDFANELRIYRLKNLYIEGSPNADKYFEVKKEILNSMIREKILLSLYAVFTFLGITHPIFTC